MERMQGMQTLAQPWSQAVWGPRCGLPKGELTIARQFTAGFSLALAQVPDDGIRRIDSAVPSGLEALLPSSHH